MHLSFRRHSVNAALAGLILIAQTSGATETKAEAVEAKPDTKPTAVAATVTAPAQGKPASNFQYSLGVSYNHLSYHQGATTSFVEHGLSVQASLRYTFVPERWDLEGGVSALLLPFGTNLSGFSARMYALELTAGYHFHRSADPWQLSARTGIYYETLIFSPNLFGFRNLGGPELQAQLIHPLTSAGQSVGASLKFAPISGSGFGLANLSTNQVFGAGIAYSLSARSSLHADWERLKYLSTLTATSLRLDMIDIGFSEKF